MARAVERLAAGTMPAGQNLETLPRHYGAIAEELHDLGLTELVIYDEQGRPDAIAETRIVYALIGEVRELATRLAALEDQAAKPAGPAAQKSTARKGRAS